ncbi:hypothetical protein JCM10212_000807 [Sporobolomyces blumeae]
MTTLDLRPVQHRSHPRPDLSQVDRRLRCSYAPSRDGVDSNLLILLHGLGDTLEPFKHLGESLNLPQTAVLSLQAPTQIPLLDEPAFEWWASFDPLGEIIPNPNPTATLQLVHKVLSHLVSTCQWNLNEIHLFGFAQGGTVAGELGLYSRANPIIKATTEPASSTTTTTSPPSNVDSLGSIVAVSAPLLSHPTTSSPSQATSTPVCLVYRAPEAREINLPSWKKAYGDAKVTEVRLEGGRGREGMPRGMDEWRGIMKFWSEVLTRRSAIERSSDVFELTGGVGAARAAGATGRTAT